jgi:opacity protein-like surface antigen
MRDASQSLSVSGNLGATFYDVIEGPRAAADGREIPDSGWGSFATASLGYRLSFPNVSFEGSIGAAATYYPGVGTSVRARYLPGGGARFGWSWDLTDRTEMTVGSGLRFVPLSGELFSLTSLTQPSFGPEGSAVFLPPDTSDVGGSYLDWASDVSLRHRLSRRWSLSADYGYRRDFVFADEDDPGARRLDGWSQAFGTALHFAVTRTLSVHGGYRVSESRFSGDERAFRSHSADVGIDYGDAATVQLTRRTRLSFGGGASAYTDRIGNQRYRLNGNVDLVHDIGRTWNATLGYARGIDSSQLLFRAPVLSDSVTAALNGLLTRRLGFHAGARASHGAVGFTGDDNAFTTIAGNAGLQAAMTQQLAVGLDYTYYQYRFGDDVTRPAGLLGRRSSQGVHAYLSVWAPIFQRGRPNASR